MQSFSEASSTNPASYTVLLMENAFTNRELHRRCLVADSSCRYTFLEADSAPAAAAICQQVQVDAVLVDSSPQTPSGVEVVQELQTRLNGQHPPIVIVANDPAVPTEVAVQRAVDAMKLGAEDYLVKQTLTPEQLQFSLRNAIENARLRLQLQHQEERFRVSIENMLDCFGCFSAIRDEAGEIVDFRIDYLNQAACNDHLMPGTAQIGRGLCECLPIQRGMGLFDDYCRVVETGEPLRKETLFYDDRNTEQHLLHAFDLRVTKLDDGVVAAWRDVTDYKRMELELRQRVADLQQQQHRLQTLIDIAPVGIGIATDSSCAQMQHNAYLREMLNVSPGCNISKSAPAEEQPQFKVMQNGQEVPAEDLPMQLAARLGVEVRDTEFEIVQPDGAVRYLLSYASPLHDDRQEIIGSIGAFLDITNRKQIEAELREREELLQLFIQHVPAGVVMFDREMRYLVASDRWLRDYGLNLQDIVGRLHYDVFPDLAQQWRDVHQRCLAGAVEFCEEDPFLRADGSIDWLRWEMRPWYTNSNEIGGVILFIEQINDRKASEDALRESHDQLTITLESITDAFFALDHEWRFTFVNPQATRLLQKHQSDLMGRTIWEEFPAVVGSEFEQAYCRAVAEQVTVQFEAFYPPLDSWFEVRAYPSRSGLSVYFQNVNARKAAEAERERLLQQEQAARAQVEDLLQQLTAQQSRLEQTLQQMPIGVSIVDAPSGRIRFHNEEAIRLLRHPLLASDTYEGYAQYGAFHDDGRPYQPEEYPTARSLLTGEVVKATEMHYRRGDGTHTVFSVSAAPIFDAAGEMTAVVCTFEDVASLQQAEAQLRQSEERLRLALEATGMGIWDWDIRHDRVAWAGDNEKLFGLPQGAFAGTYEAYLNCVHPDDRSAVQRHVTQALQEKRGYTQEFRIVYPDGTIHWLSGQSELFLDDQGNPVRLIGTNQDVTPRKQAEQEREALLVEAQTAREEAEAANRSKDDFVSLVAHELRSPLNAIMGWAKILQMRSFDPATTNKALETIVRNTQSQVQLVEDLLDVSRMVRGTLPMDFARVYPADIVKAAIDTVRPTAETKQLQLEAQICHTAPVWGDIHRLQQVILNLLTNAIKFTPAEGRVKVLLEQHHSQVCLQVSDTGKGISADFLPHVFERFQQDGQNTTAKQGLGLGLAIVKYIVEQHGGAITAESAGIGQGATFTMMLPLLGSGRVDGSMGEGIGGKQFSSEQSNQTSSIPLPLHSSTHPPLHPSTPQPLTGTRVLLVDDDLDMLTLTTLILEQAGATVQIASSAAAALNQLEAFQPHVLVSDIAMPGQNGYRLLQQMRATHLEQPIPAVALTAFASHDYQEQSLRSGFQHHLTKPVDPDELVRVILSVIH